MSNSLADPAQSVGIITRTKNNTLLLWRAMESVLEQTHANWVHVIFNDGGEIEPVERLVQNYQVRYGNRLIVLHHENSGGPEAAFNQSAQKLQSRYIAIHDDDDSWQKTFLEQSIASIQTQQALVPAIRGIMSWCMCVHEHIEGERLVEDSSYPFNNTFTNVRLADLLGRDFIPAICFLFERSVLEDIGYFDETFRQFGVREFILRFVSRYEIGVLQKQLSYYRQCPGPSPQYRQTLYPAFPAYAANESYFRNELIRRDLAGGKFGMGSLLALMSGQQALASLQHHHAAAPVSVETHSFASLRQAVIRFFPSWFRR